MPHQDYVSTRWYRAPELCGSFSVKGKPLFPRKNVVHQLDAMTDLLGTPPPETVVRIRNEKEKMYLNSMPKKPHVPFTHKFPNVDPLALQLLEQMLAFDPKDRPTAKEALVDPYFHGLANAHREPSTQPISKLELEFENRKLTKDDVRELIYREYHPQMLQEYLCGGDQISFIYPRGRVCQPKKVAATDFENNDSEKKSVASLASTLNSHPNNELENENRDPQSARSLLNSASISASRCIGDQKRTTEVEELILEVNDEEVVDMLSETVAAVL